MNPMTNDEHPGIARLQARCAELEAQVTERTFDLDLAQADLSTARARLEELEVSAECWGIVSSGMVPELKAKYVLYARHNLKR